MVCFELMAVSNVIGLNQNDITSLSSYVLCITVLQKAMSMKDKPGGYLGSHHPQGYLFHLGSAYT